MGLIESDEKFSLLQHGAGVEFKLAKRLAGHIELKYGYSNDFQIEEGAVFFRFKPIERFRLDFGYKALRTYHDYVGSDINYDITGPWIGLGFAIK